MSSYHCFVEILRIPLEQTVLKIKILPLFKGHEVEDVLSRLIQIPESDSIQSAVKRLQDLGALDDHKELTPLGFHVAALPVDVRYAYVYDYHVWLQNISDTSGMCVVKSHNTAKAVMLVAL